MRYRERSNLVVQNGVCHQLYDCFKGSQYDSTHISEWVNGFWESMTDAGSAKTDKIRTRYLEHQRSTIQSHHVYISYPMDGRSSHCDGGRYTRFTTSGRLGPGYYIQGNPWILSQSEIEQNLFDAFRFFESGCADKETLLANFAWELPDVKTLWPALKDFLKQFKKDSLKRVSKVQDARRSAKTFSSTYLAYQFGVAPLIGDLVTIYEKLKGLHDHIKWLRKNSGQITKVEYRSSLKGMTLSSTLPYRPTTAPGGSGGYWRKITELRSGFKAWAYVTYDVSKLSDLQLSIKSLLRGFGLNNPAAVVWEAVPYSFVADWISNVGDLIGRLEVPIKLPCVIHDCGYGVWTESTIEDWYTSNGHSGLLRTTNTRGYGRRPGLPITLSKLSLDTPTAKQFVLGLALAFQKF